jgi:hypothetical protein
MFGRPKGGRVTPPVDLPREKLAELVSQFGVSICQHAEDFAARLRSECGLEYEDECAALVAAVDAGVVAELQRSLLSSVPRSVLLRRLVQRLANGSGLPVYLAQWSVECWALAFGVVQASDDLLSLKLERLAPLLNAAATDGAVSAEGLDRLVHDAVSGGIDEPAARAYVARYAARHCWLIGQTPETPARAREAPVPPWTIPRGSTIPGTGVPSPGPASAGAPAPTMPDARQAKPHSAGGRSVRWWSGAVFVLVVLVAIAATAIDRNFKPLPASPSPSSAQQAPTQTAAPSADPRFGQRPEELRKSEQIDREQRVFRAAHGNREALQGYIDSCEVCTYREAASQEKVRLDAADQEERTYTAARGNKYALQAYVSTCTVCAHRATAQSEISAIEAAQPRRISSTINICGKPVDFVIDATGVPEPYRGFLGVWTGAAWNSRVCGGLIVSRVKSDGTAEVVYIYGPLPEEKFPWKAQYAAAMISASNLTFTDEEGGSFVFSQTDGKTLHGFFTGREGTKLNAILTRDLSSVP